MFVVRQERPVTTDRRVGISPGALDDLEIRQDFPPAVVGGRCWCAHQGPGRLSQVPRIVRSERDEDGPRQQVVCRLPALRTCCAADPLLRAVVCTRSAG